MSIFDNISQSDFAFLLGGFLGSVLGCVVGYFASIAKIVCNCVCHTAARSCSGCRDNHP